MADHVPSDPSYSAAAGTAHLPIAARMPHWSLVWYAFWRDVSPGASLPATEEWVAG